MTVSACEKIGPICEVICEEVDDVCKVATGVLNTPIRVLGGLTCVTGSGFVLLGMIKGARTIKGLYNKCRENDMRDYLSLNANPEVKYSDLLKEGVKSITFLGVGGVAVSVGFMSFVTTDFLNSSCQNLLEDCPSTSDYCEKVCQTFCERFPWVCN